MASKPIQFLIFIIGLFVSTSVMAQKASFTISPTSGCAPLIVTFTNTSTGSGLTYFWKFGNGNTSSLQNPNAIYYNPGKFTVTLIVKDAGGSIDSVVQTAAIEVFESPKADFSASKRTGCPPLFVQFSDMSKKGTKPLTSWIWDFGDGTTSMLQNPSHSYTVPGNYKVTLIVKDSAGCSSTISKANYIQLHAAPTGTFNADDSISCSAPLKVNFKPKNVVASGVVKYLWDFGDGSMASVKSPTYTYINTGNYTVSLQLEDTAGCKYKIVKTNYIQVGNGKPDFSFILSQECDSVSVSFFNKTTPFSPNFKFRWDFGDGSFSDSVSPKHLYKKPGVYSVKMVVIADNCKDSIIKKDIVKVFAPDKSDFYSPDTVHCELPHIVNFFANLDSGFTVQRWEFGDSSFSTETNPVHKYIKEGSYTVKLILNSDRGCSTSITKINYIRISRPNVEMDHGNLDGCEPLTVDFNDVSTSVDPIVSRLWTVRDNNFTTKNKSFTHTFKKAGTYKVTLFITTAKGCVDSVSVNVRVGTQPQADFTFDRDIGCIQDLKVTFTNLTNTHLPLADSVTWFFGDGKTSNLWNPVHQYRGKPGKFSPILVAYNNGCSDTLIIKDTIKILPPYADFQIKTYKCRPDSVQFINNSVGADSTYWNFGDSTTSIIYNPTHVYTKPGTFLVKLRVKNNKTGCYDSTSLEIVIDTLLGIGANKTTICIPDTVKFYVTGALENVKSVKWSFGNGDSSTALNPKYVYSKKGKYDVVCKIETLDSCVRTFRMQIGAYGVISSFSITPTAGCVPLKVKLINHNFKEPNVRFRYYEMPDGSQLPIKDSIMEYTFLEPAIFQGDGLPIVLRTTDYGGCSSSSTIYVYPSKPIARFDIKRDSVCTPTYRFIPDETEKAGIQPLKFKWTFGDGSSSTNPRPVKTYPTNGKYVVKLVLTDGFGCKDSLEKYIVVNHSMPKAAFSAAPTSQECPPMLVSFSDKSIPGEVPIVAWKWYFGDGSVSFLPNPQKLYDVSGNFGVSLKVTDALGCTDSVRISDFIILNGPRGSYSFDIDSGCVPLTVRFTAKSKNASHFKWDLGDGTIIDGKEIKHEYIRAARYIPLLILSDSFGCTYTLPPYDSIFVYPHPVAEFTAVGQCVNSPVQFTDISSPSSGFLKAWEWDFGDGNTSTKQHPSHVYKQSGLYKVKLKVTSSRGCENTITQNVRIGKIKANFEIKAVENCIGTEIFFNDKSVGDTTVVAWKWYVKDTLFSTLQNTSRVFIKKGKYNIKLVSTSALGCTDTAYMNNFIVGDTVLPAPPVIYRATVNNDNTVELSFTPNNEVDFKAYIIYRENALGNSKAIDTVYNSQDTIILHDTVYTLHNSYCFRVRTLNYCGRISPFSDKHCTINLTAKASINKAQLNWNAYEGWDSVLRYDVYREDIHNAGQFYLIGKVDGAITHYEDTSIICYSKHVYKVVALENGGFKQISWSDTAATVPIYVSNLPATKVVRASVENNKDIVIEWRDLPARIKVKSYILQRSEDGINFNLVDSPFDRSVLSYLDKNVKVQEKSYTYQVFVVDSCGDVSPQSNIGKSILLKADTTIDMRPYLSWSPYLDWKEGVKYYDIELKNTDGSFHFVGRTNSGSQTDFTDFVTNLNSRPQYCYRITAHRNGTLTNPDTNLYIISQSNEACVPVRSTLYIPNAFTPNGDEKNDSFQISGLYIKTFNIKIYDRWGTKVFESDDMNKSWDGRYKSADPVMDAYKYVIISQGVDEEIRYRSGTVTIVR